MCVTHSLTPKNCAKSSLCVFQVDLKKVVDHVCDTLFDSKHLHKIMSMCVSGGSEEGGGPCV